MPTWPFPGLLSELHGDIQYFACLFISAKFFPGLAGQSAAAQTGCCSLLFLLSSRLLFGGMLSRFFHYGQKSLLGSQCRVKAACSMVSGGRRDGGGLPEGVLYGL